MKTVQELNNSKAPLVVIDAALNEYQDKVQFPDKLERANRMLKTAKLPPRKPRTAA